MRPPRESGFAGYGAVTAHEPAALVSVPPLLVTTKMKAPSRLGSCGVSVPFFNEVARNEPAFVPTFSSRTLRYTHKYPGFACGSS